MKAAEELLGRVVAWAARDANVRSLVLVGSRARTPSPDDLADIDLQVYAETTEPYTRDDAWLSDIGEVWVRVRDEYSDGGLPVPTRLVIFRDGVKVDFAFYRAGSLSSGVRGGLAYEVLLDKDRIVHDREVKAASSGKVDAPSQAEFTSAVEEFWFEMYHVAKYLARNELWLAKSRDWATKQLLLRIMDWQAQIGRGQADDTASAGQRAGVSKETWEALHQAFAGFGLEESWSATFATMSLFRRLATETAATLGFAYPVEVDRNISRFIQGIHGVGRNHAS